jgi:hypothetical protein
VITVWKCAQGFGTQVCNRCIVFISLGVCLLYGLKLPHLNRVGFVFIIWFKPGFNCKTIDHIFCEQFEISLLHCTPYYPQGNRLAESSNKILIKLIKKILEDNNRAWDSKLKFFLWADRVTTKKSLGISPFQLVYGIEVVFPTQLALSVANFLQDFEGEPNHVVRRIHQLVEVQQIREQVMDRAYSHQ